MAMERIIRIIAGSFVLISLAIGYFVTPWAYLFTAFVGLNLFQSGITNWCLMVDILGKCGVKSCCREGGDKAAEKQRA